MPQENPADAAAQDVAIVDEPITGTPAAEPQAAAQSEPSTEPTQNAAAAEAAPTERIDPRDFIMKGLAAIEAGEELPGSQKDAEPPPAKEEKPEEDKPKPSEEPEPEEKPAAVPEEQKTEEVKTPEENDEAPKPVVLLSREDIDKEFPRAPLELRGKLAEAYQEVQKTIDEYGGEHYRKPMQMIAEGLQSEDNIPIVAGVLEAQGVDGFVGLQYDILKIALEEAMKNPDAAESDAAKYFVQQSREVTDRVLKEAFGEKATLEFFATLMKAESEGILNSQDVLDYYSAENGAGEMKTSESPEYLALKKERDELKAKLEPAKDGEGSGADTPASNESQQSAQWETEISDASSKAIADRYIATTVLKPLSTDAPEVAEAKAAVKTLIDKAVANDRSTRETTGKLRNAALKGRSATANYAKGKDALIEADYQAAKKLGQPFEALFNLVYSTGRNTTVLKQGQSPAPGANDDATERKEPTMTTEPKAATMTLEAWRTHMREQLAGPGQ